MPCATMLPRSPRAQLLRLLNVKTGFQKKRKYFAAALRYGLFEEVGEEAEEEGRVMQAETWC